MEQEMHRQERMKLEREKKKQIDGRLKHEANERAKEEQRACEHLIGDRDIDGQCNSCGKFIR